MVLGLRVWGHGMTIYILIFIRFTNIHLKKPFDKVCNHCSADLSNEVELGKSNQAQSQPLESSEEMSLSLSQPSYQSQQSNFSDTSQGQQCKEEQKIEAVNKILETLTISPIKENENQAGIERKLSQFSTTAKDLFKIPRTDRQMSSDKNDLQKIMENVKKRIAGKPLEECLPYLTILPHDWSYKKYQDEFDITKHSVKVIKNMQQQQLEKRERRKRSDAIDSVIIQRCVEFYRKAYISRELPGESISYSLFYVLFIHITYQMRSMLSPFKQKMDLSYVQKQYFMKISLKLSKCFCLRMKISRANFLRASLHNFDQLMLFSSVSNPVYRFAFVAGVTIQKGSFRAVFSLKRNSETL